MPVRVLELHFLLETGKVLTAWCGTEKPFANLFAHIMQMEALSKNTVFLYGGGRDTPDRGCVIGANQTPSDLCLQGREFIGIFEHPRRSRPEGASATARASSAASSSNGPGIQSGIVQRLRTPSRSPKRRKQQQQQLHLESKAESDEMDAEEETDANYDETDVQEEQEAT